MWLSIQIHQLLTAAEHTYTILFFPDQIFFCVLLSNIAKMFSSLLLTQDILTTQLCAQRFGGSHDHVCPGAIIFLQRVTTYFLGVLQTTDSRGNPIYITKMEQAWDSLYPDTDDDEDRFFKDTDTFRVSCVRNCQN